MLAPMPNTEPGRLDYDSPQALSAALESEGLAMSKRFGQNFLVDRRSRLKILAELEAAQGAHVWELGPGLGAMTELALDAGLRVTAFEIDHGFARVLRRIFGHRPEFRLVEGDFLNTWRAELSASGPPDRVFGNLPYSVANAMVAAVLEGGLAPPRMVFTVQKEAAQRMTAVPGTKDYSAFSVLCASCCRSKIAFDLSGGSFWPVPRVTSSAVRMVARPDPVCVEDRGGFSTFVRAAFASRRKTLRNNLRAIGPAAFEALPAVLGSLGIREDVRAEALRPEELGAVYRELSPTFNRGRAAR